MFDFDFYEYHRKKHTHNEDLQKCSVLKIASFQLPDVSPTISKLEEFDLIAIQNAASEGIKKLNQIENDIEDKLKETLSEANAQVVSAGEYCIFFLG